MQLAIDHQVNICIDSFLSSYIREPKLIQEFKKVIQEATPSSGGERERGGGGGTPPPFSDLPYKIFTHFQTFRPKWLKSIPYFRSKGSKTIPFGATNTYSVPIVPKALLRLTKKIQFNTVYINY